MALRLIQFLAIMLTALALVPSGRHLAALPNKMAMAQAAYGTVNLSGRVSRIQATGSGHWGLLPTHATDFSPDPEFLGPGSSVLGGSDVIATEVEEVIDLIVG